MELELVRTHFTDLSTIGRLSLKSTDTTRRKTDLDQTGPICWILEDRDRGLRQDMPLTEIKQLKIHGKTAIPTGRYQIVATMSARFKVILPILLNVPGYEGIRIHTGNTSADTEGCLLPGVSQSTNFVGQSRLAFDVLFNVMKQTWRNNEQVWITIS